jgi:hypothetical protein
MQDSRWHKRNAEVPAPCQTQSFTLDMESHNTALSATQRYVKAKELTQRLNLVLSNCGTSVFTRRMEELKDLVRRWESCADCRSLGNEEITSNEGNQGEELED